MPIDFYIPHSAASDPGDYAHLLPDQNSPEHAATWVQSLLQHPRGEDSRRGSFSDAQHDDLLLRDARDILGAVADRSLYGATPGGPKVGAVCRDFALLVATTMRHHGIPARLRVGFANYLVPDRWEDHWLCEWFDGHWWRRLDVEFAGAGDLPFDPSDVPPDRFLSAGQAWRHIRSAPEKAPLFGVSDIGIGGEAFVAGSLFRDAAALRKVELKPWDLWGDCRDLPDRIDLWEPELRKRFDELASILTDTRLDAPDEPQLLHSWPLPRSVTSYPHGAPIEIALHRG